MADEVLDVLAARGILHVMFEQGRLGYFYDSAREVLTDNGYGVITKKEAFAFWSIYMRGGNNPNEVQPSSFSQCGGMHLHYNSIAKLPKW